MAPPTIKYYNMTNVKTCLGDRLRAARTTTTSTASRPGQPTAPDGTTRRQCVVALSTTYIGALVTVLRDLPGVAPDDPYRTLQVPG